MFFNIIISALMLGILELMLLFRIAEAISFLNTLLICVATAATGSYLARRKGLLILSKIQQELNEGRLPKDNIIEGIIVLFSGFMLLFPGIITDIFGFMLLVPGNRRMIREWLKKRFRRSFHGTIEHR